MKIPFPEKILTSINGSFDSFSEDTVTEKVVIETEAISSKFGLINWLATSCVNLKILELSILDKELQSFQYPINLPSI